ncbi:hypothetical protein ES703_114748 [subsurface metagenome]
MANDKQELIDQFHKNSIELVKINLNEWKGELYVDVRIWMLERPQEPGSVRPSHKGIRLNVELLPQLIKGLEKAQARVKAKSRTAPESGQDQAESAQNGRPGKG